MTGTQNITGVGFKAVVVSIGADKLIDQEFEVGHKVFPEFARYIDRITMLSRELGTDEEQVAYIQSLLRSA